MEDWDIPLVPPLSSLCTALSFSYKVLKFSWTSVLYFFSVADIDTFGRVLDRATSEVKADVVIHWFLLCAADAGSLSIVETPPVKITDICA